jgi:hypothetical protein
MSFIGGTLLGETETTESIIKRLTRLSEIESEFVMRHVQKSTNFLVSRVKCYSKAHRSITKDFKLALFNLFCFCTHFD